MTGAAPPLIHAPLLDALLTAGQPMTLDALARTAKLKVVAVQAELDRLVAAGCELETHPQHGVELARSGLSAWSDYLAWRFPRRRVEVYRSVASTQDAVRRLVDQHGRSADGALVVADEQTEGRGRLGRRWVAPPGACAMFSTAWVGSGQRGEGDRLTFASSVAVARAVETCTSPRSLQARIKWPNDVVVDGRKIAGILVESFNTPGGCAYVIGIGINVDLDPLALTDVDADLPQRVASLRALGRQVDRLTVLTTAILELDRALRQPLNGQLLDDWRRRSVLLDHDITLLSGGREIRGHVMDLDPHAGLIVRTHHGQIVHLPAATTSVR